MLRVMMRSSGPALAAIHSPASRWSRPSDGCHHPAAGLRNPATDERTSSARPPATTGLTQARPSVGTATPTKTVASAVVTTR